MPPLNIVDYLIERGYRATMKGTWKFDDEEWLREYPAATRVTDLWGQEVSVHEALERTRMPNVLVYDIEIENAIPDRKGGLLIDNIRYCEGWGDYEGMGIAVVGVWSYRNDSPVVICRDNLDQFARAAEAADLLVGFNNLKFDTKVLAANGVNIPPEKEYDICREMWIADGLDPDTFNPKTHGGYSLENAMYANLGIGKSGSGASAPIDWQQGRIGKVITYCLADVVGTKKLFDLICVKGGELIHPKYEGQIIKVRKPDGI